MTKEYDISIIGEITLDDVFFNGHCNITDAIGGDAMYAISGANMFLDGKANLFVRKGNDFDLSILNKMSEGKINYSYCKEIDKYNIHLLCLFDRKGNRYFITQLWGGNDDDMAPRVGDISDEFLNNTKCLHIAPIIIEYSKDLVMDILKRKPDDLLVSVDPHYDGLSEKDRDSWFEMLKKIDVFLPSELELKSFFDLDEYEDYLPYVKKICDYGPSVCCVKLGEKGCLAYEKETGKTYSVPPYPYASIVDVTGCGDTFCGAFMSSYLKDRNVHEAMINASIASSFTIEHYGCIDNYNVKKNDISERYDSFKKYLKEKENEN